MESTDKLYQNIRTGEVKPLPYNVYKVVKRNWRPVPESKSTTLELKRQDLISDEKLDGLRMGIDLASQAVKEFSQDHDISAETSEPADGPTKEDLQQEYEQLTGKKPDGRLSVKKLTELIEETKGTK